MAKGNEFASKPESFFKRPILIIGPMRSGTTLLGRMLNTHPKIYIRYLETNLVRYYGYCFEPITNRENMVRLIDAIKTETRRNKGEFTDVQKDSILQYLDNAGYSYQNLYAALALYLFETGSKERWGEKYAGDCRDAEYFFDLYPDGQVIHITRALLDVYSSNKKRTASRENLEPDRKDLMVIEEWRKCHERSFNLAKIYGRNNYLFIKYEDLVKDSKKMAKQICKFLNLEWNSSMIDAQLFVDDSGLAWEPNTSFSKFKGIAAHPISRYKEYLLPEEQDFIKEYLARIPHANGKKDFKEYFSFFSKNSNRDKNPSDLYQQYAKKMRRGFISAGKYRIALFVDSITNPADKKLAEFLHHSYHDVEVISTKFSLGQYRFPVHCLEDDSNTSRNNEYYSQRLWNILDTLEFDFIHINGQVSLAPIIQNVKNSFNKRVFLTNGGEKVDTQLLQYCDRIIANSEKEYTYYLNQGISQSKILQMSEQEFLDNVATIYRNFVIENKILMY